MCRGSEANPELIRLARVRQLFQARPSEERTETDVLPSTPGYKNTIPNCFRLDEAIPVSS